MTTDVLVMYDNEVHLETDTRPAVGDTYPVVRGNGPREGDRIGTATVTGYDGDAPVLHVELGR